MMDAMDVDWCLFCNKQTSHGKPYCSRTCKQRAMESTDAYAGEFSYFADDATSSSDALREPSTTYLPIPVQYAVATSSQHQRRHTTTSSSSQRRVSRTHGAIRTRTTHHHAPQQPFIDAEMAAVARWPKYNEAGIREWIKGIPAGSGTVAGPTIGPDMSSAYARPEFPLSRQRPAGPALCTDTTQAARTSLRSSSPISLPSPRSSTADSHAEPNYSFSTYSLRSALTESIGVPESTRGRTKTQVRAGNANANRPSVFEGFARRFRSWGANPGTNPLKLHDDAPAEIFMETTTTTVPASPSPSPSPTPSTSSQSPSPHLQRSNTTRSNVKSNSSGFTVRANGEASAEDRPEYTRSQVFDLRVPLVNARSPLAIRDSELKEVRAKGQPKRGIWIAGCERLENGWIGFGPAHYERGYRDIKPSSTDEQIEREFREFEAWRARGRKAVRL